MNVYKDKHHFSNWTASRTDPRSLAAAASVPAPASLTVRYKPQRSYWPVVLGISVGQGIL